MARTKKKKNPVVKAFMIIFLVIILLLAAFIVGFGLYQSNILSSEVTKITSITPGEGEVDDTLATTGEYQKVEKLIKDYMSDYIDKLGDLRNALADQQFEDLLSVDNLQSDGPEFTKSMAYLDQKEEEIADICDTLLSMADKESYDAAAKEAGLNFFFQWEYDSTMETIANSYMYGRDGLNEIQESLQKYIDYRREDLEFLKKNKDSWSINDGKISFASESLMNEYNTLIARQ